MKILTVLTYYRPHTSGLTIYAERLARAFAKRGHQVTVMTSQYESSLPRKESMDGVKIIRVPVLARVSKGVLAPTFGLVATQLVATHDVVETRFYFDPMSGRMAALEMFPDVDGDPCEIYFDDYQMIDGRMVPDRMEVIYGDARAADIHISALKMTDPAKQPEEAPRVP